MSEEKRTGIQILPAIVSSQAGEMLEVTVTMPAPKEHPFGSDCVVVVGLSVQQLVDVLEGRSHVEGTQFHYAARN